MSSAWIWALVSVLVVSGTSLVGLLTFAVDERRLHQATFFLVSLSVGAMFGDVFIHLLPEAFAQSGPAISTSLSVLAGLFLLFGTSWCPTASPGSPPWATRASWGASSMTSSTEC
jgi:hypothetical protein